MDLRDFEFNKRHMLQSISNVKMKISGLDMSLTDSDVMNIVKDLNFLQLRMIMLANNIRREKESSQSLAS